VSSNQLSEESRQMNTYLMTRLIEARYNELVDDAYGYRQVRAARTHARVPRRSRRFPVIA
jgi:hypothetical protein